MMITQTMTPQEIVREVKADYETIIRISADRLVVKYNRERIKRKVPKANEYVRCYTLKSARKNPWLIFIENPLRWKGTKGHQVFLV